MDTLYTCNRHTAIMIKNQFLHCEYINNIMFCVCYSFFYCVAYGYITSIIGNANFLINN